MNTQYKTTLLLLFIFAFLFAGSATLNILQLQKAQDVLPQKTRANLLRNIADARRTGILVQNNVDERWIVLSYQSWDGQTEQLKAWVNLGTTIQRIHTKVASGTIEDASTESTDQKDLKVGEPIYVVIGNSVDRKRLETSTILVGDLLPLSR